MNCFHTCSLPIIHRDPKPVNILIDHLRMEKITDFELSRNCPKPSQMESDRFAMIGGDWIISLCKCISSHNPKDPCFCSHNQVFYLCRWCQKYFHYESYNEQVDVYSFATILYYLTVGKPPWPSPPGYMTQLGWPQKKEIGQLNYVHSP